MKTLIKYIKNLLLTIVICFFVKNVNAQEIENNSFYKHEIGIAAGAFPIIGVGEYAALFFLYPNVFKHIYHFEELNGNYMDQYNFGSYTLNYNYNFNLKHSMGISCSWVGTYINEYWNDGYFGENNVDGCGWENYFTLQGNYRHNYYNKDKISLYWGIYTGLTLCIRDENIIPKNRVKDDKYEVFLALQINAFGIELGKKYKYFLELGIGTQGLLKTGFRYKF